MTAPTTDRPTDPIRDAFEAMLAFFICLIGPRPHRKITPAEEIGALAACEVETDFTPDSPPTDLTRLRDLIQRAAEEYAQIRAEASKRLGRGDASRRERKAADLAAGPVTEEELAEIEARTSGPGPLAGDGELLRRCRAEIVSLRGENEEIRRLYHAEQLTVSRVKGEAQSALSKVEALGTGKVWVCSKCPAVSPADAEYEVGNMEPCVYCEDGTARVVLGKGQDYLSALRGEGWTVAVHNDYRLNGESRTFWLFTKDGRAIKGEGRTDEEAQIDEIRWAADQLRPYGAEARVDFGGVGQAIRSLLAAVDTVAGGALCWCGHDHAQHAHGDCEAKLDSETTCVCEGFADRRPDSIPPADASLEARAQTLWNAYRDSRGTSNMVDAVETRRAFLDGVSAADASRPGLTEVPGVVFDVLDKARAFVTPFAAEPHEEAGHLAKTTCRICHAEAMLAEIEGAEEECRLAEKRRPGLTEEQAREVLDLLDDAIAEQEDGDGTETSNGNARLRIATFRGIKAAILRASRGETGPAPSKPAKESDDAPDSGHDDTALTAEQYDRHKARIASGEIPGGAPTTHTVDFGCARPTHAGPEATCSLCHPAPEAP